MKKMFCLITPIDYFIYFTLCEASFQVNQSCQTLLSISKMAEKWVHKNIKFWKINKHILLVLVLKYHYKRLKFYHKLILSGQIIFYFSTYRAITAYVGEILLSKYNWNYVLVS